MEENKQATKPQEAAKNVPGDHIGVQTAQTTAVNPPDAVIPSGADTEESIAQIEALEEQEEGTGMSTTDGYRIDESERLDNYAVEPEMYVEDK